MFVGKKKHVPLRIDHTQTHICIMPHTRPRRKRTELQSSVLVCGVRLGMSVGTSVIYSTHEHLLPPGLQNLKPAETGLRAKKTEKIQLWVSVASNHWRQESLAGPQGAPAEPFLLIVTLPLGQQQTHHLGHVRACLEAPLPPPPGRGGGGRGGGVEGAGLRGRVPKITHQTLHLLAGTFCTDALSSPRFFHL